jgi:predicted RNA-binding Zn ribbon-like protein
MPFTFVSGDLALDFAGTVLHRDTAREDLLSSPRRLAEWAAAAGLVDVPPGVSEAELARALAVREAVYRLARAAMTGADLGQEDIGVVNAAAAAAPVTAVLTTSGVQRAGTADAVTATVARAAVALLGGPGAGRIRECGDPPCTRLFVDTSRARSRRWCDMGGCGNRAKVAGFRARRSVTHAGGNAAASAPR